MAKNNNIIKWQCNYCGQDHLPEDLDTNGYCQECIGTKITCQECGKTVSITEIHPDILENYKKNICMECYHKYDMLETIAYKQSKRIDKLKSEELLRKLIELINQKLELLDVYDYPHVVNMASRADTKKILIESIVKSIKYNGESIIHEINDMERAFNSNWIDD